MALLDLIQNIFSGPKAQQDAETQTQETSGLSGVEKYLAKQALAAKEKAEAAEKQLSGVERYLQKLAETTPEKTQAEAETEADAVEAAPVTGVEKYLARQKTAAVKEKVAAAAPAAPVPVTGVDKYLAKKGTASDTAAVAAKSTPAPEPAASKAAAPAQPATAEVAPAPQETVAPAKKPAPTAKKPAAAPSETAKEAKSKTGGVLKLSENATQCQARTAKGTQCKNTAPLTPIERTIDGQRYEFVACALHNEDSFKPFPGLLEKA